MDFIQLLFMYLVGYGPILLTALAIPIGVIGGVGLIVTRQHWLLIGLIAVILSCSQSTWGMLEATRPIYSRGAGLLPFPFIVWGLWGMALLGWMMTSFNKQRAHPSNLSSIALLFLFFFAGNIIVGFAVEAEWQQILAAAGLINFFHLAVFVFCLLLLIQRREHLNQLLIIAGAIIVLRGLYGIVRWAAFGGDPANVYANIERAAVKLTYFDICDSLVAALLLSFLLLKLINQWGELSTKIKLACVSLVSLELLLIVFSYRRTAWIGLLLALVWIYAVSPARAKSFLWLGIPPLLAGVSLLAAQRFARLSGGGSTFDRLFHDLGTSSSGASRFTELNDALQSFYENPIFGVGSWGRFSGGGFQWHTGEQAYTFVHSGPVHLLFKTGLVGTAFFIALIVLVGSYALKWRKRVSLQDKMLIDTCIAGALFMLPDFLMGTPIPQFRTMLLYGLLIGIPYVVVGFHLRGNASGHRA